VLRTIEHRIESLFEGVFGRAFRSHVQPVEFARKLAKEMDDHKAVSLSRVYAPNEYHLYLSPRDREQFRGYEESLLAELADFLAEHARREGYALVTRPRVLLREDSDLRVGEFGIATRMVQPGGEAPVAPDGFGSPASLAPPAPPPPPAPTVAAPDLPLGPPDLPLGPPDLPVALVDAPLPAAGSPVAPSGPALDLPAEPPPESSPIPPVGVPEVIAPGATSVFERATDVRPSPMDEAPATERFAIVLGGRSQPLDRDTLTLGRSRECDITIDDPSISRKHAELRRQSDGYSITDLGSTNGIEVNGRRVQSAALVAGDRVQLGQTEVRYERL
jgi:hypothetical protein